MPRYRFEFHECDGTVTAVGDGIEAADLVAARAIAVEQAREIMAREVRQGRVCLSCWIVISDRPGNNVMTLQFGDAIEIAAPAACNHESEAEALSRAS